MKLSAPLKLFEPVSRPWHRPDRVGNLGLRQACSLLNLGLLGIIALTVISLYETLHPSRPDATATTIPARMSSPRSHDYGSAAAEAHLFGAAQSVATDASPAALDRSDIKVTGIVFANTPTQSLAELVINGREQFYRYGDSLPDGTLVSGIDVDRITLNRGGERFVVTLNMKQADANAHFASVSMKSSIMPEYADSAGNDAVTPPSAPYLNPVQLAPTGMPQTQLTTLRQQLVSSQLQKREKM